LAQESFETFFEADLDTKGTDLATGFSSSDSSLLSASDSTFFDFLVVAATKSNYQNFTSLTNLPFFFKVLGAGEGEGEAFLAA
jgi:hypothetical protein